MKKSIILTLILLSMLCISCEKAETQSEVIETIQTTIQETSVTEVSTVENITTIGESTQLIEETVNNPSLYPEKMFNQMSHNLDGLNITLYIQEDRYYSSEVTSSNIDLISSYFKDCDYQSYTFENNSYNGNSMNIIFYPKDSDGNIYDSYSINFYDISNLNLEDGNCKIDIKSTNNRVNGETPELDSYITNIEDIQSFFEELKSIF